MTVHYWNSSSCIHTLYSRIYLQDHIAEVFEKWDNIEDEIWAKVIILERNRRVAKAYARAPILTINGSEDGFDGFKIGVNGFDNPLRDYKVKEFKAQIGAGCKLKMGDNGDILVKRVGKGNIYIKNILEETAVSNEILKLPHGLLELDRALKLFDMKKFKQNMNREMKRQYPDRSKIETQVGFVKNVAQRSFLTPRSHPSACRLSPLSRTRWRCWTGDEQKVVAGCGCGANCAPVACLRPIQTIAIINTPDEIS